MAVQSDGSFSWGSLGFAFAAAMLLIATGLFVAVYGGTSLVFGTGRSTGTLIHIGPAAWSLIFLFGGIALCLAGCNLLVGRFWARLVGIGVACIALLTALLWLDTYPLFSLGLVILNLGIIWALTLHWKDIQAVSE
jgi:hypothetical protein